MAQKVTTLTDDFAHVAAKAAEAERATLELVKALAALPAKHLGLQPRMSEAEEAVADLAQVRAWANCEAAKLVVHEVTI